MSSIFSIYFGCLSKLKDFDKKPNNITLLFILSNHERGLNMIKTLGVRIRTIREDHEVMQKDLADALSVDQSTLSKFEQDKRIPSINFVIAFCQYFNVSTDFLLGLSDDYRPPVSISIPPTLLSRDPYADLSVEHRATLDALADVFRKQETAQGQKEA